MARTPHHRPTTHNDDHVSCTMCGATVSVDAKQRAEIIDRADLPPEQNP